MLYYFLYQLIYKNYSAGSESIFIKGLNVFQYISFRTVWATLTALAISLLLGGRVIEKLKELKVDQPIQKELSEEHQAKQGTPTMGGLLILLAVVGATLIWARLDSKYLWLAVGSTLSFGLVGFLDDYLKVVKGNSVLKIIKVIFGKGEGEKVKEASIGLTITQKSVAQIVTVLILWGVLWYSDYPWNLSIPFLKETALNINLTNLGPILYLMFIGFVLYGSTNSVNITDGIDGLASSVAFIAVSALTGLTYVASNAKWASYLDLTFKPEAAELTIFCGAMVGALLGFLWFNAPPAQVFMGDVGALAIGGALGTVAILTKQEFMLPFIMGVFIIEFLSSAIQRYYFKFTRKTTGVGKRIFLQAPIHHHFQMAGWREPKIVFRFVIIAIVFALMSLSTLKLR